MIWGFVEWTGEGRGGCDMTSFDERIKQTALENSSLFDNLPHLLPITDNLGTKYHYCPCDSGGKNAVRVPPKLSEERRA